MFRIDELIAVTRGRLISGQNKVLTAGVSIDSRTLKKADLFIAIKGTRFDGHDFIFAALRKKASAVIVDRLNLPSLKPAGIPVIKVRDTLKALSDIAAYHRRKFDIPIIGITGSNGKTTTKEMTAWLLEKQYRVLKNPGTQNNHIGLPMALLRLNKNVDVAVLEMGTNHFGEIGRLTETARPNIGIITNVGSAHLEYLRSLKGVYREKRSLINNLVAPSVAILNMDDRFLRRNKDDKDKFVVGFALENNADYRAAKIKKGEKGAIEFTVNSRHPIRLNTLGTCNIYNGLAAITVARLLGMDYNTITQRLSDFEFPKARLSRVNIDSVSFIDDTYNSNPSSLSQALEALAGINTPGRKVFIMGDMLELGGAKESLHRLAGKRIAEVCDALITVGTLTRLTAQAARQAGLDAKSVFTCDCSRQARSVLYKRLKPNRHDIVLIKGSRLMQMERIIG